MRRLTKSQREYRSKIIYKKYMKEYKKINKEKLKKLTKKIEKY